MLRVLETLIRHASDSIDLVDGSGLIESRATVVDGPTATVVTTNAPSAPLQVPPDYELTTQPRDLKVIARPGRLILWRNQPSGLLSVVDGRAGDSGLTRPAEPPYPVAGQISFASHRYNPRLFTISAGGAGGHVLPVYLAAAAVMPDASGVLSASVQFEDGSPASWAVVTARVALPTADAAHTADRTYRGQADRRGELRIVLTGLPAPTRAMVEADALNRIVTLSVQADPARSGTDATDPDALPAAQLRGPGAPGFAAEADFTIRPGGLIPITSQSEDHLTIRPTP